MFATISTVVTENTCGEVNVLKDNDSASDNSFPARCDSNQGLADDWQECLEHGRFNPRTRLG